MFAFLAGWRIYAVLAIGLALAGLGAWGAWQQKKAEIAEARAADAIGQRDRAIAAAKTNEATIKRLEKQKSALDAELVTSAKRERELEAKKRQLGVELDALKEKVSEADKACLDRGLPQSFADRLLDS